jgi:hypothetical protein
MIAVDSQASCQRLSNSDQELDRLEAEVVLTANLKQIRRELLVEWLALNARQRGLR